MRSRLGRAARRLTAEEAGFTLVELLVAASLGLALIGSATLVFTSAIQSQPRAASRGSDIEQARTAMERITRELRQGWSVPVATSSELAILTYVKSATCGGAPASTSRACRVTYSCTSDACARVEASPDGTSPGAARQVVTGITGPAVFTYSPPGSSDPDFVGVLLSFPADPGEDTISLSDGVALRNPGAPSS